MSYAMDCSTQETDFGILHSETEQSVAYIQVPSQFIIP